MRRWTNYELEEAEVFTNFGFFMIWKYQNKTFKGPPPGIYGYTYKILDDKNKAYYGKKAFTHRRKKKLSKRQRKLTGKRVEVSQVDSGWKTYTGSCKPLQEYIKNRGGTHGFKGEILKLCKNKTELSYAELELLITERVLFIDCWNHCIAGRYYKGKI